MIHNKVFPVYRFSILTQNKFSSIFSVEKNGLAMA